MKEEPILTPISKDEYEKRSLQTQIEVMRNALKPEGKVYDALIQLHCLMEMFFNYLEKNMDKKMAKVTKQMKTASRDIKEGKEASALKALKGAEKKNVKLTKIDREVRDPEIKAYKKMKQKGC